MSIDINWDAFTTGPDGATLALQIRDFIHDKFQRVALPKFIQSVQVISFDFGSVSPDVEIRSIGDPYVEFYEDDDDEGGEGDGNGEDDAEEEGEIGMEEEEVREGGVEEGEDLEWRSCGEEREEEQREKQRECERVRGGTSDGAADGGGAGGDGNCGGSDGGIGCSDDGDGGGRLGGGLEREMRRFRRRGEMQWVVAGEGKGMGGGEGGVGAGAGTGTGTRNGTGVGGREERKRLSGTASGIYTNSRIASPSPTASQVHTYPHNQPQYHHHHHHHHHSRTLQQQQIHHHSPSTTAGTQHCSPGLAGFRSASDSFRQGGVSTPLFPFSAPPTSNLHYFHSALSSAFNGGVTPAAPLPLQSAFPLHHHHHHHHHYHHHLHHQQQHHDHEYYRHHHHPRGSSPPSPSSPSGSSLSSLPSPSASPRLPPRHLPPSRSPTPPPPPPLHRRPRASSDIQITARVRYMGDIRIELTTELLLDYPARSFVSLPVRLVVTGLSFDGVACVVWMGRRLHFCFLEEEGVEDAPVNLTTSGIPSSSSTPSTPGGGVTASAIAGQVDGGGNGSGSNTGGGGGGSSGAVATGAKFAGGMLKEIKVESEIGERGKGKQVLKNVGKVERFVLEQVRRIFEEEFVFPSTWTFLV